MGCRKSYENRRQTLKTNRSQHLITSKVFSISKFSEKYGPGVQLDAQIRETVSISSSVWTFRWVLLAMSVEITDSGPGHVKHDTVERESNSKRIPQFFAETRKVTCLSPCRYLRLWMTSISSSHEICLNSGFVWRSESGAGPWDPPLDVGLSPSAIAIGKH